MNLQHLAKLLSRKSRNQLNKKKITLGKQLVLLFARSLGLLLLAYTRINNVEHELNSSLRVESNKCPCCKVYQIYTLYNGKL